MLKGKEFPEKDFNIENSFLRIEEEEYLNMKNQINENESNENYLKDKNKIFENDGEDSALNHINSKLFIDEEFQPGLFTSFDFKDKIKSIINNSLNNNNMNSNFNLLNKISDKDSIESNFGQEELKLNSKIDDSFILDTCLGDKDITYDNIIINFDQEAKNDKKADSVSEDKRLDFEYFKKSEAIPEYENQIISYQNLNHIEKQKSIEIFPEKDEVFDEETFTYFLRVAKEIKDDGLKNKVKLLLKLILYQDKKTKKYIFSNKIKNHLLKYWKTKYEKELSEATFKEKNKILQQKIDNANPNNKVVEISKKNTDNKKKTNLRKHTYFYRSNFLFKSVRNDDRPNLRINSRYTSPNKNYIRRFSTSVKPAK
jgi:hypothetical protein